MLSDVAIERESEARSIEFQYSTAHSARSAHSGHELARLDAQARADMDRKHFEGVTMEVETRKKDRMEVQAELLEEINHRCRKHQPERPAFLVSHTPRQAYFKYGADGNLKPPPKGGHSKKRAPVPPNLPQLQTA